MQRYFLELSYAGGAYHGWQVQANARSVQEVLDAALSTVCRMPIVTVGCGRTDTGVHARQLFAHLDLPDSMIDPASFLYRLNRLLPADIAVHALLPVRPDAHARFDAVQRTYEYQIHFRKDPFLRGLSWQMREAPDMNKMNEAAGILKEYRDFSCFSKSNTQVFTNNCRIDEAEWFAVPGTSDVLRPDSRPERMIFRISADRFLRNMVRAIVGTLMEIGRGRQPVEHMRAVIESGDRSVAGASVPAEGLYLTAVRYPDDLFCDLRPGIFIEGNKK